MGANNHDYTLNCTPCHGDFHGNANAALLEPNGLVLCRVR
jgi:hypothetical protein